MPASENEESPSKQLHEVGLPISLQEVAEETLRSRADLSYQFFDNVEINNVVARQSLFHGVLFRNCIISDSDFSRSDFEGARFENCHLKNISFETADIRSTKFATTDLQSCLVRSAVCSDNLFNNCEIDDCDFEDAAVQRNTFQGCTIKGLKNRRSTWLQSTFGDSSLADFSFSDCTSSYSIFKDCSFKDVTINADAFGITFGLTESNLNELQFGFLGQSYGTGMAPSLDEFLQQYRKRKWLFHAHILALNFKPSIRLQVLTALVDELASQVRSKAGVKRDDVEFLFRVMTHLKMSKQLPFAVAVYSHDAFAELQSELDGLSVEAPAVDYGLQQALYLASDMYDRLSDTTVSFFENDTNDIITATLKYKEKPTTRTLDYLKDVQTALSEPTSKPKLLEAREGSWIEVIQMSVGSLFAFYVSLYLVNGCLAQLTMVRARTKKLMAKRLPNKFLQAASDPSHELPKPYQDILIKLLMSQISSETHTQKTLAVLSHEEVEGLEIDVKKINT